MLRHALEIHGHRVVEARDQPEAEACLRQHRPVLVLSDLKLPSGDGHGVLRAAKEADPHLPVIVMTAYGTIQDAVTAMRDGALDFLAKPIDPDHLQLLVDRAIAQRRVLTEYVLLKDELARRRGVPVIIGDSPALAQTSQAVRRGAATDATILLEGESGTGKELFARAVHAWSARTNGPFVAINCAAIPETLLEAELFGYERGAFTGATQRKAGKFELADRGTLFLDEIGELPLGLQGKILRALEDRSFERLGGTTTIRPDVRVVAATNRSLRTAVARRQFREDLFFRLSVFPVTVPPLRDRREDIPVLARHFIGRACAESGRTPLGLLPDALDALTSHRWPGNVRELHNCIERAVILADGDTITRTQLALDAPVAGASPVDPWTLIDLSGTLQEATARAADEAERRKIQQALTTAGGDAARAADLLQIGYQSLLARMREYGLSA